MRAILSSLMALALTGGALAQEPNPIWMQAMNNLAQEYVTCAAYFSIVAIAMENSHKQPLAEEYYRVATAALENAKMAGVEAGLLDATHGARFDIAVKEMQGQIAGNTSNISILFVQYSDPCTVSMENLEARINFWVDKETTAASGN